MLILCILLQNIWRTIKRIINYQKIFGKKTNQRIEIGNVLSLKVKQHKCHLPFRFQSHLAVLSKGSEIQQCKSDQKIRSYLIKSIFSYWMSGYLLVNTLKMNIAKLQQSTAKELKKEKCSLSK